MHTYETMDLPVGDVEQLTLSQAINELKNKGYVEDFNLIKEPNPDDFEIDETFRFDILTDPADQSVLYAMHNKKTGAKGVFVNGFGIYSDPVVNKKIRKVH